MLKELFIKNMAVVEELRMELEAGFNVLSGETGAGKSIIIDAVGLLLGKRASSEYLRAGTERAIVEGTFLVDKTLQNRLQELGLESHEELLILTREISRNGKNICRINNRTVTLAVSQAVGEQLVAIHGQHEYHLLFSNEQQMEWLDAFGGEELLKIRNELATIFHRQQDLIKGLDQIYGNVKDRARQRDFLKFQLEEIDSARLIQGEKEDLYQQEKIFSNAQRLLESTAKCLDLLCTDNSGVRDVLAAAVKIMQNLVGVDERLMNVTDPLENALYQLEDAAFQLSRYQEEIEYNPAALKKVQDRIELITKLEKKYGDSAAEILLYREQIGASLEELENNEFKARQMETELEEVRDRYHLVNGKLGEQRRRAAKMMEEAVNRNLAALCLRGANFSIVFQPTGQGPGGSEGVEYYFAPNPGEPAKPLAKIASGGELSRVMLAIKACLAAVDAVPTLIFDEIDAGIGGNALQAVANELHQLGRCHQVLCVTHAPQIASHANHHFKVSKEVLSGRTLTRINLLSHDERVTEIARMLAGDSSPTARQHALALIKASGAGVNS